MKLFNIVSLLIFLCSVNIFASDNINKIKWSEAAEIVAPENYDIQHGLAMPFAGVSNGMLLVAGGANFPDAPVHEGGTKVYHKDIFAMLYSGDKPEWKRVGKLPVGIAYGVSVPYKNGVLCIGGNNNEGAFNTVFLMTWNKSTETVDIEEYPNMIEPMSNMAGDIIDNKLYIAAGSINGNPTNRFFSLDLDEGRWVELESFPGKSRVQAIGIAQNAAEELDFIFFSGGAFSDSNVYTDAFCYNPKNEKWTKIANIQPKGEQEICLYGGSGIAMGSHHIVFVGGCDKEILTNAFVRIHAHNKAKESGDEELIKDFEQKSIDYFLQKPIDFKFNKKVIVYHTITDTWITVDSYPYPAPAGAPMVKDGNKFYVINGEIKPGVRSAKVYVGDISPNPNFGLINWIVLAFYMLGMLYIGYYFMKKEKSTDDFFKGGGRIPWWAAGMSIFATMLSAITFMAIPAKTYATDWRYYITAVTIFAVAFPVIKYYLPFFRRLKITTAYEYLELRFNGATRSMASSIFILFMVARMALVLFLPSLALTTVTGIDIYTCIILMGIITIIYCTMGGVEAVVWGDFIQGIVLMGGAVVAVVFLINGTEGGLGSVIDITIENEKMKTFDFAFDITQATFWVVLLGGIANNLISYSSDQTVIQRYLTTSSEKAASRSIMMNGILSVVVSALFYFIGTAMFAFYKTNPGNLSVAMANTDAIFPQFIMTQLPVGVAGVLIAAIFSATMSTISSNINSVSTAFTSDFFIKMRPDSTDKKQLSVARWTGVISGSLGIILALLMATWNIRSLFDYFNTILGLLTSGLGGIFVLAIFFKRTNSTGAIVGFIVSTLSIIALKSFTPVSFWLYGFLGIVVCVVVGYITSYFTGFNNKELSGLTWKTIEK